jgi:bacteriocin biosynthesis cyclodehydratase domain-containing protein
VEVRGLPPPLRTLLLELHGSWGLEELVARAVELGARESAARELLAELLAEGGLVDAAGERRARRVRAEASVLVSGAGPVLAQVAGGLAAAGVRALSVHSEGQLSGAELASCPDARPGDARAEAVVEQVRRLAPSARVRAGAPRRRPDLAVLTDAVLPDADRLDTLAARGVPHLVVRLIDGVGLVGPLVLPGRSACLRCLDLHRAARDPRWPLVAADLVGVIGSASPATSAATAALGVEQALLALDGFTSAQPPPTVDGVLELDPRRGWLRRQEWSPHPACGCGAAHTARSEAPRASPTCVAVAQPDEPGPARSALACTSSGEE